MICYIESLSYTVALFVRIEYHSQPSMVRWTTGPECFSKCYEILQEFEDYSKTPTDKKFCFRKQYKTDRKSVGVGRNCLKIFKQN